MKGKVVVFFVLAVIAGAHGSGSSGSYSGAGSSDSSLPNLPPPAPLQPDPATETPDHTYCADEPDGTDCRPATADDPEGCMRADENATDLPYDPNNPDAGIPQDCLDKGY